MRKKKALGNWILLFVCVLCMGWLGSGHASASTKPTSGAAIKQSKVIHVKVRQKKERKLSLSWTKRRDRSYYLVQIKGVGDTRKKKVQKPETLLTLQKGVRYRVQVKAIGSKGRTLAKAAWFTICIPEPASRLVYTRTGEHSVRMQWIKGKGASRYAIYRKKKNGKYHLIGTTKQNHFSDRQAESRKEYRYQIRSVLICKGSWFSSRYAGGIFSTKEIVSTENAIYTYESMKKDLSMLQKTYTGYVHVNVIGHSADQRNIFDVILGNPNASKSILVVAAIHGREYMTSQLCMAQIEYYLKNYHNSIGGIKGKNLLRQIAIHYIPMSNPDGVTISQSGFGGIHSSSLRRKLSHMKGAGNPSLWKANANGVDLNRNFNYKYQKKMGKKRGAESFSGTKSNSEPEAKALIDLVSHLKSQGDLRGVINYHAEGCILFGGAKGSVKERTGQMYALAKSVTGYADSASYEAKEQNGNRGNFREYVMYKRKIPSITLEIGTGACPLPASQFGTIWNDNRTLILREAQLCL